MSISLSFPTPLTNTWGRIKVKNSDVFLINYFDNLIAHLLIGPSDFADCVFLFGTDFGLGLLSAAFHQKPSHAP